MHFHLIVKSITVSESKEKEMENSIHYLKSFVLRWFLAPGLAAVLSRILRAALPRRERDPFEQYRSEEWSFLVDALEEAKVYLEFGSGTSTQFVSQHCSARIRSIETDLEWSARVQEKVREDVEVVHVDLGPVGAWGRPTTFDRRENFSQYFSAGFSEDFQPDLILIDGRFRVACFLSCLLLAAPGTKIIFDDYPSRPYYKIVEEILLPRATNTRQALFVVPDSIDSRKISTLRNDFKNVMD